jgi:pimeloyl-ACP methyl ester carboxylesterase
MKFNFLQKQTSRREMLPGSATPAAWRTKPSWMLVAGSDRTINPDLERWYAKRAGSHTVEVAGASYSVYVSHPNEVSDLIESAARTVEM